MNGVLIVVYLAIIVLEIAALWQVFEPFTYNYYVNTDFAWDFLKRFSR